MTLKNSIQYLINRYGRNLTLRYITSTGIDIIDPSDSPIISYSDLNILGYQSSINYIESNGLIQEDDIKLCVGYLDISPSLDDKIIDGYIHYNIIKIIPYYDKDEIIYYELILRK
jgi:hypothetical protein